MARRLGLLALLGWALAAHAAEPLSPQQLADALRQGGYVIYLRHTATDFSRDDSKMRSHEDCANQRPLSERGRDEARALAGHLKRLGIPVDRVYASPFCRTVETAMLAFGRAEKSPEVRGGPVRSDDPDRYAGLKRILGARPKEGSNNAIASHGNPFYALFGPPYLAEGEAAVVRPGGAGPEIAGRIRLADWEPLR